MPVEHPVVLTGEEDLMEYGERLVKIYGTKTADDGKATESICSRGKCDIHSEGAPWLVNAAGLHNQKNSRANKRDDECVEIKVEQHLAVHEVRLTLLAVFEIAGLELISGYRQVVHKLVVRLHDSLAVGARVLLDAEGIYLHVVEWTDVDRQTDGNGNYQYCDKETKNAGENLVFHKKSFLFCDTVILP